MATEYVELRLRKRDVTLLNLLLLVGCAAVSYGLLALAQPFLKQYALARPNSRSSHTVPTPQGGGIFIVVTTLLAVAAAWAFYPTMVGGHIDLAWVLVATLVLAFVGAVDDFRSIAAAPRLMVQLFVVGVVIAALPVEMRIVPALPWWIERGLLLIGGVWFVNLVNFMDGIDWITVAEVVPVTAGLGLLGATGALPREATVVAFALCGATIGFAPLNRPVARLFLGDVGSLPIGLLLAWLLILLAGNGHLAAALLLPLYYLADATITLVRRFMAGEPIMQAHRRHFYQCAVDSGVGVYTIVGHVFLVNIALVALATLTVLAPAPATQAAALAAGSLLVAWLLFHFARGKR